MNADAWRATSLLAGLLLVSSAFGAVALHAADVAAGYRLARAQERCRVLRREERAAEQRVAALRAPSAVLERARALGLAVDYPERLLVVRKGDLLLRRRLIEESGATAALGRRR